MKFLSDFSIKALMFFIANKSFDQIFFLMEVIPGHTDESVQGDQ